MAGQMGVSLGDPQVAMDQMTMSYTAQGVTNHPFWGVQSSNFGPYPAKIGVNHQNRHCGQGHC